MTLISLALSLAMQYDLLAYCEAILALSLGLLLALRHRQMKQSLPRYEGNT